MAKPDGPVGVFVAVFESEELADKAMGSAKFLQNRSLMLDLFDTAKVVRRPDGKVEVRHARDAKHGAKTGLIAGAIFGLVFPPSIIVSGTMAAAGGAAYEKVRKSSVFEKGHLKEAGEAMLPGRTAIVIVTEPQHMETLREFVPGAVAIASHTFKSLDAEAVREWIDSLAATRSQGQSPD